MSVSQRGLDVRRQAEDGWEQAKEGLRFAINFLRTNAGIEDESLLSSPMFIHSLAAVSRIKDNKLTGAEQRALLHWLLVANARGRYSRGSTETLLNEDLAILFRAGTSPRLMDPVNGSSAGCTSSPATLRDAASTVRCFRWPTWRSKRVARRTGTAAWVCR